jgi:para-nitrobenzyl esterase
MITYWTNFAKNHDPNGAGLPAWPAYHDAAPQMMYLAGSPRPGPLMSAEGLKLLDEYFAWRRQ